MKISTIIAGVAVIVAASSCKKGGFCKKGHDEVVSEVREVEKFTTVHVEGAYDVVVKQDASLEKGKVIVEAPADIQDDIKTKVSGGVLTIDNDRCFRGENDIVVYVHSAEINEVSLEGSGNISSDGVLKASTLRLTISGSGNIETDVACATLKTTITGSGNATSYGTADTQKLTITGSGNIHHYGVSSAKADVSIEGSGNVEVSVTDQLDVDIDGSGSVTYRGYPEINQRISGSGELKSDN